MTLHPDKGQHDLEFGRCQRDRFVSTLRNALLRQYPQALVLGREIPQDRRPPQQRAHAGHQFIHRERLRQVVVCAVLESFDPIVQRVACRQHQAGSDIALCSKLSNECKAVAIRQASIHDQRGILHQLSGRMCVRDAVENVDFHACACKGAAYQVGHAVMVLEQRDAVHVTGSSEAVDVAEQDTWGGSLVDERTLGDA